MQSIVALSSVPSYDLSARATTNFHRILPRRSQRRINENHLLSGICGQRPAVAGVPRGSSGSGGRPLRPRRRTGLVGIQGMECPCLRAAGTPLVPAVSGMPRHCHSGSRHGLSVCRTRSTGCEKRIGPPSSGKCSTLMARFGTAFFLFFFCIGVLTVQANLSQPVRLNERAFFPVLVLFLGYTVVWTIGLFRAFRVPEVGDR